MVPHLLFDAVALLGGAIAMVTDLRSGRIPNLLTLPVALAGVALHATFGGASGTIASVVGGLVSGFVPWLFHRATRGAAIGGGDVKLFAALGVVRGGTEGLEILLSACVLLATFALIRLAFAGRLRHVLMSSLGLLVGRLLPARRRTPPSPEMLTAMRMGPAILAAIALVCVLDHAPPWVSWLL